MLAPGPGSVMTAVAPVTVKVAKDAVFLAPATVPPSVRMAALAKLFARKSTRTVPMGREPTPPPRS